MAKREKSRSIKNNKHEKDSHSMPEDAIKKMKMLLWGRFRQGRQKGSWCTRWIEEDIEIVDSKRNNEEKEDKEKIFKKKKMKKEIMKKKKVNQTKTKKR